MGGLDVLELFISCGLELTCAWAGHELDNNLDFILNPVGISDQSTW